MAAVAFDFSSNRFNFSIYSDMAKQEMFVTVYKLEIFDSYDNVEDFAEAISDYAVVYCNEYDIIITASSEALSLSRLANTACKYFGPERYNISTLGLLGPFKKLN